MSMKESVHSRKRTHDDTNKSGELMHAQEKNYTGGRQGADDAQHWSIWHIWKHAFFSRAGAES